MTVLLGRGDVEQFREIVTRRFGLHYDDGKLDYLADVLQRRIDAADSPYAAAYLARLTTSPSSGSELRTLAEQLTVGETYFFRNVEHFRVFAQLVLPARIRANADTRRLRILSAGCASGEEPYSIAALVRDAAPELHGWDVQILGLDLNPRVLAKARSARYSAWSLRATDEDARRRYFRPDGAEFVLHPEVQRMVTFEERNLTEPDPVFWQGLACDAIFCRNVLMYFTPDTAKAVVHRLTQALVPSGFLFLGHAETLRGLTHEFQLCHTHDTFYYCRRDASQTRTAADEARPGPEGVLGSLPAVVAGSVSWIDVIQRSSARIASLADDRARSAADAVSRDAPPAAAHAAAVARIWDLGLVLDAMRQERFSEALALICALPPESHRDPDALLVRAVVLTNNGRIEESEEVCAELLALDDLNAGAHYLRSLCRERAGDLTGAIEHDQTAIYLDAGFAMPHLHLGIMAKRAGDLATAQLEFGHASQLLAREDAVRLLLFGGGFSRETLLQLCHAEQRALGAEP